MVRLLGAVILLALAASWSPWSAAAAADFGTQEEAKAMAIRAAAYLRSNGVDRAIAAFSAPTGPFRDRDLYVYVVDKDCVVRLHPVSPSMNGVSLATFKDVDGKLFGREICDVQTEGWTSYKWLNPTTKAVALKRSYNVRVDDLVVGVGAYEK